MGKEDFTSDIMYVLGLEEAIVEVHPQLLALSIYVRGEVKATIAPLLEDMRIEQVVLKEVRCREDVDEIGRHTVMELDFLWRESPFRFSVRSYPKESMLVLSLIPQSEVKVDGEDESHVRIGAIHAHTRFERVFGYSPYCWPTPVFMNMRTRDERTLGSFVMLISNDLKRSIILSSLRPLAPQLARVTTKEDEVEVKLGLAGTICKIPKGFSIQSMVMIGDKPSRAMLKWGSIMRSIHGRRSSYVAHREVLNSLHYWTDAGSAYWYRTLPGMNYLETMMEIGRYLKENGLKVDFYEVDSWWYPKGSDGGALEYEEIDGFKDGLRKVAEMGKLIVHMRWLSRETKYAERYNMKLGKDIACPLEPLKFFSDLMKRLKSKGVFIVEHDWLTTVRERGKDVYMREVLKLEEYLDSFAKACREHGLLAILCMPDIYHYMMSLKHNNILMIRTSEDYGAYIPRQVLLWQNVYLAMMAHAVGPAPFFDVFITKNYHAFADLLARVLMYSAVAIGDYIDKDPIWIKGVDMNLLNKFTDEEQRILRPREPAILVDYMFIKNPLTDRIPLIIRASAPSDVKVLAIFNVDFLSRPIKYDVTKDDLDVERDVVLYDITTNRIGKNSMSITVEVGKPHIVLAFEESEYKVVGLKEVAVPPLAIAHIRERVENSAYMAEIEVARRGTMMMYVKEHPRELYISGKKVEFRYDEIRHLMYFPIDKKHFSLELRC